MTALVGYAPFETERKKIALHKKKHLAEYFFFTAIKVPLIGGQNYGISNFIEIFLHPNNLTVVNCTHQRLRNVVHISKGKYKVFDMKIIPDHIQLRKSFSQEGYSTWPHLESEGFGTWKWPVFGFSAIHCIGLVFTLVFDGVKEKNHKEIDLLKLAIYMVQNHHAGEQK